MLVPPAAGAGASAPSAGEAPIVAAPSQGAPTWTTPLPVSPTQQVVKQFVPKLKLPETVVTDPSVKPGADSVQMPV